MNKKKTCKIAFTGLLTAAVVFASSLSASASEPGKLIRNIRYEEDGITYRETRYKVAKVDTADDIISYDILKIIEKEVNNEEHGRWKVVSENIEPQLGERQDYYYAMRRNCDGDIDSNGNWLHYIGEMTTMIKWEVLPDGSKGDILVDNRRYGVEKIYKADQPQFIGRVWAGEGPRPTETQPEPEPEPEQPSQPEESNQSNQSNQAEESSQSNQSSQSSQSNQASQSSQSSQNTSEVSTDHIAIDIDWESLRYDGRDVFVDADLSEIEKETNQKVLYTWVTDKLDENSSLEDLNKVVRGFSTFSLLQDSVSEKTEFIADSSPNFEDKDSSLTLVLLVTDDSRESEEVYMSKPYNLGEKSHKIEELKEAEKEDKEDKEDEVEETVENTRWDKVKAWINPKVILPILMIPASLTIYCLKRQKKQVNKDTK
ncbi:hypothetical protein PRVXH_002257 [Proteinivorax hydrogeniformans]|uniref:Uncharacterized protein n=1 Tax=Proteinivorax hydrogeniformans TaxID=1826727 RepID=A0AAU8HRX2_9FIRM